MMYSPSITSERSSRAQQVPEKRGEHPQQEAQACKKKVMQQTSTLDLDWEEEGV
jgi:hypothetical protein